MPDTFRFPNGGYDVNIVRKQDVLDAIDDNIVDKELALAVVKQCEQDAINFITEEKWVSIPFMGNIKMPDAIKIAISEERKELIANAKEELTKEDYILFRRKLVVDTKRQVKTNTYYRYLVSTIATKHRRLYRKLVKTKGEVYTRLYLYTLNFIKDVVTDGEEFIDRQTY